MTVYALLFAAFLAGDPTSGPQVGDELKDFRIHGMFGPQADKEFRLIKDVEKKPTLVIFVQKMTRPALRLMRPVDEFAAKEEKLSKHFVFVTDDTDKTKEFLKRAEKSLNLQSPIGICLEGKDGPPAYGLNDQVAMTIVIAKDGRVVANFALVDPNETDARKVNQAIAKALSK